MLSTNYRNASEILEIASEVVAQDTFDDLEGTPRAGGRELSATRRGGHTTRVVGEDRLSIDAATVTQMRTARFERGLNWGDMAVLAQSLKSVDHTQRLLNRHGVPFVELTEYDGVSTAHVKVGTFKRAKGLEFKFVFLPGLNDGAVPRWPYESDEVYGERAARMRRELFVGMTRARDGLWLGYVRNRAQGHYFAVAAVGPAG